MMSNDQVEPTNLADSFYQSLIESFHEYAECMIVNFVKPTIDSSIAFLVHYINYMCVNCFYKEHDEIKKQFFKQCQDKHHLAIVAGELIQQKIPGTDRAWQKLTQLHRDELPKALNLVVNIINDTYKFDEKSFPFFMNICALTHVDVSFKRDEEYQNQLLEIKMFIPFLLQKNARKANLLRVTLQQHGMGDSFKIFKQFLIKEVLLATMILYYAFPIPPGPIIDFERKFTHEMNEAFECWYWDWPIS